MRKLIIAFFAFFIITSVSAYAQELKKGDYVKMGVYNGRPIVWRCIETDDGRALMMSDEIITLKAYDAKGDTENDAFGYRKSEGSNLWTNSTIRYWLNSDSDSVSYHDTLPNINNVTENPYSTEKGFLKSFSETEKSLIKESEITTVINSCDNAYAFSGTEEHILESKISGVVSNYSDSYVVKTTDRIFLPSVNDVYNIATDVYTFSPLFEYAVPTDEAVMYSELKFKNLDVNSAWNYWLRDAVSYSHNNNLVRIVTKNGSVDYDSAYNGVMGVRPVFYIDTDLANFSGGTGEKSAPYCVRAGKWLEISDGDFAVEANKSFELNVLSEGLEECEFVVMAGGTEIDCSADNMLLSEGIYDVCIKAVLNDDVIAVSNSVNVTALEYETEKLMLDNDFESSDIYKGFVGHGTTGGSFNIENENGNKVLKLTSPPSDYKNDKGETGTSPYLILPYIPADSKLLMIEADMKFTKDITYNIFPLKFKSGNWIYMVSYEPGGKIVFKDYYGNKKTAYDGIKLNEWHNYKYVYDITDSALTLYVDNKAFIVNEPVHCSANDLNYCNINSAAKDNVIYVDNISQKIVAGNKLYSVSYEKNGTSVFYADCSEGVNDFPRYQSAKGKIETVTDDESHGNVIKLTTFTSGSDAPFLISPELDNLSNEVLIQADYRFPDAGKHSGSILSVKTLPDSKWLNLLAINTNGEIVLKGTTGTEKIVIGSVNPDKWYTMRIIFNKSENTATVSINDEFYTKVNISLTGYSDFNYLNINPGTLYSGDSASVLVDNVRISHSEKFISPYETNIIKVADPCNILSGYKLITGAYRDNKLVSVNITEITKSGEYIAELEDAFGDEVLKTFIVEDIETLKSVPVNSSR